MSIEAPPDTTFLTDQYRPGMSTADALAWCKKFATSTYENFTVVSWFLPKELRADMYAVYAFCRTTDNLGDEAPGDRLAMLDEWQADLERALTSPQPLSSKESGSGADSALSTQDSALRTAFAQHTGLDSFMHFDTKAVHAGMHVDEETGAIAPPLHLSTTFERRADGQTPRGFSYIRDANPTQARLEEAREEAGDDGDS